MNNYRRAVMRVAMALAVCHFSPLLASAQEVAVADTDTVAAQPVLRFGYLSYDLALRSMPDYAVARQQLADLRTKFDAEQKRVEDEFNRKYEDFLEGQKDFPATILKKRQSELQELMERSVAFKEELRRELAKAEKEAMAPLRLRLNEALAQLGQQRGYAFILNTDAQACPWLNPLMGESVADDVARLLQQQYE